MIFLFFFHQFLIMLLFDLKKQKIKKKFKLFVGQKLILIILLCVGKQTDLLKNLFLKESF